MGLGAGGGRGGGGGGLKGYFIKIPAFFCFQYLLFFSFAIFVRW